MKPVILVALAVLAGCAQTPTEITSQVPTLNVTLQRAGREAAVCIERKAEEFDAYLRAAHRPLDSGYEVIVRGVDVAIAVIRIDAKRNATVWMWRDLPRDKSTWAHAFVDGC